LSNLQTDENENKIDTRNKPQQIKKEVVVNDTFSFLERE